MKKVFHLITTINRGGAENQLLVLVREQVKSGIDVHVLYLKGEPELESEFKNVGAKVHHELSTKSFFLQPFALRKIIFRHKPIVHAHLPRAELVALLTPCNFKLFVSRHNAEPFFPGSPKYISNFLSQLIELRSVKVIAISKAVKRFLLERGEIRNTYNIEVVLYGYQKHFLSSKASNSITKTSFRIGTISRLAEQKDIPTMLAAFNKFLSNHPGSTLAILGAGPLESELKKLVARLHLENSVTFNGRSPKVYEFLAELDMFILTSTYEGFGMVLLEAIDAGVPITVSNNSAIPEVLGENFAGLCETGNSDDFAEKLEKCRSAEFRKLILDQQESRLQIFNSESMSRRICEIYSYKF